MLKTYKYELIPTDEQKNYLNNILGACRLIYNLALEVKNGAYKTARKNISRFELSKQLTDLKKDKNFEWLYEIPHHALQHSIAHLDHAFTNFFKCRAKFPRFKSKKSKQSFHLPKNNKTDFKIDWENYKISLPKLKQIEFCRDRNFKGKIRNITISKTPTGKYFISILVENGKSLPKKKKIQNKTSVGIDVGLTHFATLSNGAKINNPKYFSHLQKILRIEQRKLGRRYQKNKKQDEQSNSYKKQKLVVAKLHEKIANQRKDFLHKFSTAIVKRYDSVCVENLNIVGMSATCNPKQDETGKFLPNNQSAKSGLNKSIRDAGWGNFMRYLEYKCEWYGKNFLQIGRFDASSKICSHCGNNKSDLSLSEREWICEKCGTKHDRDINAAINIKKLGLRAKPLSANAVH